jgi:hypothetical protein
MTSLPTIAKCVPTMSPGHAGILVSRENVTEGQIDKQIDTWAGLQVALRSH